MQEYLFMFEKKKSSRGESDSRLTAIEGLSSINQETGWELDMKCISCLDLQANFIYIQIYVSMI